jgi:hypothetical protein
MPKKGKNKNRKSKGFESPSSKRGKDEVTGLSLEYGEWGVVETDQVYDASSKPLRETGERPSSNYSVEFEMSEKRIVVTTSSIYEEQNMQYLQRAVAVGEFTYKKGRLAKAAITSAAANNITLINGDIVEEDAWLQQFDSQRTITDFRSNAAWQAINDSIEEPTYYAQFINRPPSDPLNQVGDFSFIRQLDNGQLFSAGWWQAPFTPNLI